MHFGFSATSKLRKTPWNKYLKIFNKNVTTWSPLGAAFNSLPAKKLNFLPINQGGLFGIETLSGSEGFYIMKERACATSEKLVAEACSPNRARKMVDVFDDLSDSLCQVADLAEFIRVAHPDPQFQVSAEEASSHISGIVETLNTNRKLYDALNYVVANGDKFPTTTVDEHVSKLFLFDFEQSGIHLPDKARARVVRLNEAILNLGQFFTSRAANNRIVSPETVPGHLRQYFSREDSKIVVNGLYADSPNEEAREASYRLYLPPDSHQEFILMELLKCRHELAVICGFPTYAHRATRSTTAETPDFVQQFLDRLNDDLRPKIEKEMTQLLKVKQKENPSAQEVNLWDIGYLTSCVKKDFLKLDIHELSAYLPLGACMEGLNNLTQELFGISLVCEEMKELETWAPNVYKLAVQHATEGFLGYIYCDFYQRPEKPPQDCHYTIRGGRELPDGSYQNPIVVLMLNLQTPRWPSPCLLTPGQLDNLVHEMGHALHSMLGRTRHQHVTGTRCSTDFAEVPSILMEYFVSDPRVLKTFTKHFQTQEPMRDDVVEKLCRSKRLLTATDTQTQVLYAVLDQKLHGQHPLAGTTSDVYLEAQKKYSVMRPAEDTAWQLRFSHLVGYGAKYYSYLLSRSIASCIWQTYFKDNPFSREQGERYRYECLQHGGGKPPRKLLNEFLNKGASAENMATSLVNEIE